MKSDQTGPQKVYAIYDIREDAYWLISLDGERRYKIKDKFAMDALVGSGCVAQCDAVEPTPPNWSKNLARYEAA